MATKTEEAQRENEERAVAGHGAGAKLPVHHPQASYVSPDLSFIDGIDLDDEREAWAKERDDARAEDVKAAVESEKKTIDLEAQAREEASEKAKEARDKQVDLQTKAGVVAAPTPTAEQIAADKLAGSGTKKS